MEREPSDRRTFAAWITSPEMLVGLSAVLLGVCGLFIAIYEASLVRRQARTSAWPYVEVGASFGEETRVFVRNTGVGPARVRAAAVTRAGETLLGWQHLIRALDEDPDSVSVYQSLISGRVLPRDSERETIFGVGGDVGVALQRRIMDGTLDVAVCYCSVYDECWTSRLQDLVRRWRGVASAGESRRVDDCDRAERSAI